MQNSRDTKNSVDQIARAAFRQRKKNQRTSFVSGYFRILHPGHIRLLRFAKELSDELVVGVLRCHEDDKQIDDETRLKMIAAIEWVDHVFLLDESEIASSIATLQPTCVVKGKEHEFKPNPELEVLETYGGKLLFSSGETTYSPEDLQQDNISFHRAIGKPLDYPNRHHFQLQDLDRLLHRFAAIKVCVIGDTIVDEYIECEALGMSREDPTLAVRPMESKMFIGGAAIVAAHMKSLGAGQVTLASVFGKDEAAGFVKRQCDKVGVDTYFIADDTRPTSLKQRFRSHGKTLLRVNNLRQHQISAEIEKKLFARLQENLIDADVAVFSDFSYGVLPQTLVDRIIEFCQTRGVMVVADSQCSSQTGDISRFHGATLISPTEHEARVALKNKDDGLVVLAEKLRQKIAAQHVIITLAEAGLLIQSQSSKQLQPTTDRLPAFNTAPKDNAGAGDCFMAATALALVAGGNIWQSAYLGSVAAACQVSRIGNLPLSSDALRSELLNQ